VRFAPKSITDYSRSHKGQRQGFPTPNEVNGTIPEAKLSGARSLVENDGLAVMRDNGGAVEWSKVAKTSPLSEQIAKLSNSDVE
jgi:hypothetical protein